ncbi:MAG: tRNA lysidine(34) synthetase TilS, partial [Candidatus Hydrogenedentes bacterium]|nr:tRNA lysidine(34) synthetase TilS [Candidatus Hydrogenedentota bacterium]
LSMHERVLVALSGGPDSVCLLHVLQTMGYRVGAAHLDHLTRDGASTEDAAWVCAWTAGLGVECHVRRWPVVEEARAMGRSFEEHARAVRYAFFAETAHAHRYTAIATGHHADDQAETLLMRLVRGTSGRGLAGIPYRREQDGVRIVRPLLDCGHDAILHYLERNALEYRTDASNVDERYFRNRIRHRLLPELAREYNPNLRDALSRLAALLQDDEQLLSRLATSAADVCGVADNRLDRKQFAVIDRALQGRVLLLLAWRNGAICPHDRILDAVEFVCKGATGRQFDLGAGVRLRNGRRYAYVEIDIGTQAEVALASPGTTRVGDRAFIVSSPKAIEPCDWRVYCTPARQVFDADALCGPLTVRRWQPGDRFTPFGMKGSRKLQDYFVDAGVSVPERNAQWLLLDGGRIAWIVGCAIDARVAVTADTRRIVEVEVLDERDAAD